jgi:hypothetical protein
MYDIHQMIASPFVYPAMLAIVMQKEGEAAG